MTRQSDKVKRWRVRQKIKLMEYKGNKCEVCEYDKIEYLSVFVFHHRNPSQKEFGIGYKGRCISIERLKKEVDKCDLLCARCHQELHDKEHWEERKRLLSVSRRLVTKKIKCLFCGEIFKQKQGKQKYCSFQCGRLGITIQGKPNNNVLKQEKKDIGVKKMAKKYNVNNGTIYRWLEKLK